MRTLVTFEAVVIRGLSIVLFIVFASACSKAVAQPVDAIIGVKRTRVQQMLRPYRILDYQRDRVSYEIEKGVRQTVLYVNDTCVSFLWAVNADKLQGFIQQLEAAGYSSSTDGSLKKQDMVVSIAELSNGKVSVLTVQGSGIPRSTDAKLLANAQESQQVVGKNKKGKQKHDRYANVPMKHGGAVVINVPLMQQEANREKAEGVRPEKDPQRNWVGDAEGSTRFLGWE